MDEILSTKSETNSNLLKRSIMPQLRLEVPIRGRLEHLGDTSVPVPEPSHALPQDGLCHFDCRDS